MILLPQRRLASGLHTDGEYVCLHNVRSNIPAGRELSPLSPAVTIQEAGRYWIASETENPSEDVYIGVPTKPGYYRNNNDGSFTRAAHRSKVEWESRLYVSPAAASMALNGEGPLVLDIREGTNTDSRLGVIFIDHPSADAIVLTIPFRVKGGSQLIITGITVEEASEMAAHLKTLARVFPGDKEFKSLLKLSEMLETAREIEVEAPVQKSA